MITKYDITLEEYINEYCKLVCKNDDNTIAAYLYSIYNDMLPGCAYRNIKNVYSILPPFFKYVDEIEEQIEVDGVLITMVNHNKIAFSKCKKELIKFIGSSEKPDITINHTNSEEFYSIEYEYTNNQVVVNNITTLY